MTKVILNNGSVKIVGWHNERVVVLVERGQVTPWL